MSKNKKIKRITKLITDGKIDKALELADVNDVKDLLGIGILFRQNKFYEAAEKIFDRVIQLNPTLAEAWSNKGVELGNLGKYDDAVKCFDEAIKINPNYGEAWSNKGITLRRNFEKYDEAVKCFDEAIKINPTLAEAYANKGIIFLNTRRYYEARAELIRARYFFYERGMKEYANKAYKYELLAKNGSKLLSKLKHLDKQFMSSLKSQSLVELKENSLMISKIIKGVIKKFKRIELPPDAISLLTSKAVCFTVLSDALSFRKVDLKELDNARVVFRERELNTFVKALNSLENFVYNLGKYKSFEGIPEAEEKFLLHILDLEISYILGDKLTNEIISKIRCEYLTDKITSKIRVEHFPAKSTVVGMENEPVIIYEHIANTKKEWVKFCLVQLDFSVVVQPLHKEFGYILKEDEREKIKNKVFESLNIARKNNVDMIIFPELSFVKEWIEEIESNSNYRDMIIIGGSYYDDGYNICPIIINGTCIDYRKHHASPFENPEITGRGMKSGNILYILQTKCGRFSVLTCIDYAVQRDRICKYMHIDNKGVDFIINPCYDKNISRFQPDCNSDCQNYDISVIQVNKAEEGEEYGKSCIIAKEHNIFLEKLKNDGFKPQNGIKYKLFQLNGEMMGIVELNRNPPPVSVSIRYFGRIKVRKERLYEYEKDRWVMS